MLIQPSTPTQRGASSGQAPDSAKRFVWAGLQLSTFNLQPSTFNFQPSTFFPSSINPAMVVHANVEQCITRIYDGIVIETYDVTGYL